MEALETAPVVIETADNLFPQFIERVVSGTPDSETSHLQISDNVRSAIKNVICFDDVKDIAVKGTGACCRAISSLKIQQDRQTGSQREQGGKVVASASISALLVPQLAVIVLQAFFRGVSTRRHMSNFPSARSYRYTPKSTLLSILVRK